MASSSSFAMQAVVLALHLRAKPLSSASAIAAEVASHPRVEAAVPSSLERSHSVVHSEHDGMPVITLTPKHAAPVAQMAYFHGGAYIHSIIQPHWAIIERLVADAALRVTVPLYALAPEHTGDEVYPQLHSLYDTLTSSSPDLPLVLAGDSAGGALAMSCALRARDEQRPAAAAVLLFAPWVDAGLSNPAIPALESQDPMLAREGLLWAAQKWAGPSRPLAHPWLSPLSDSLARLPPIAVFQGGKDIFAPDAQRFVDKAVAAGTQAQLHFYPEAFHVFVGGPWILAEVRDAFARAKQVIAHAIARGNGMQPRSGS